MAVLRDDPMASSNRNGNEKENHPRKITGLARADDVTLKRGLIGSLNLYQWLDQIRNGDPAVSARS